MLSYKYMHGEKSIQQLLQIDFVRFCIVGASGFAINFVLLSLLYKVLRFPIVPSQLVASEISLFSNFLLHNFWTYKHKRVSKSLGTLLWQFHASSWVAILGSTFIVGFLVSILHMDYIIALLISSVVALLWNFAWSKFFIWRHEVHTEEKEES